MPRVLSNVLSCKLEPRSLVVTNYRIFINLILKHKYVKIINLSSSKLTVLLLHYKLIVIISLTVTYIRPKCCRSSSLSKRWLHLKFHLLTISFSTVWTYFVKTFLMLFLRNFYCVGEGLELGTWSVTFHCKLTDKHINQIFITNKLLICYYKLVLATGFMPVTYTYVPTNYFCLLEPSSYYLVTTNSIDIVSVPFSQISSYRRHERDGHTKYAFYDLSPFHYFTTGGVPSYT